MPKSIRPVYLDCNATTPVDRRVSEAMQKYMEEEFGNAGSQSHQFGQSAAKAVQQARRQVAEAVGASPSNVVFTSGGSEANNLAILGLQAFGIKNKRRHIVSTTIEHPAVLEPLRRLEQKGFEIELVAPSQDGRVIAREVLEKVRQDTLLVSVMHVNNETGTIQPIEEIANGLRSSGAFFHVDAAQGFGKELHYLKNQIDFVCLSGHKLHAPKGIGALIDNGKKRGLRHLEPLTFGGGQERGLRPGTLPVPHIAALGLAVQLAVKEHQERAMACSKLYEHFERALSELGAEIHGSKTHALKNCINFRIRGLDSAAVLLALKDKYSFSDGSACASGKMEPSHVIRSVTANETAAHEACRLSWCYMTDIESVKNFAADAKSLLLRA